MIFDVPNSPSRNAILKPKGLLRFWAGSYFTNLFLSEFRTRVFNSSANFSMMCSIRYIYMMRSPFQIIKMIINWVSIFMTTLHSFRTWTYKGFQNKSMNILINLWHQSDIFIHNCFTWFHDSSNPCSRGPHNPLNSPMIRDGVIRTTSTNFPNFFSHRTILTQGAQI